jgi:radical SAM superfamily enzyme YgiQ (UPF0313 family)
MVPAYAATLLKDAGFDVVWDDGIAEGRSYGQWLVDLERNNPDLVMIETKTPVVKRHWRIVDDVKEAVPEAKVVLVGDHVTALPRESMENSRVDYVLTGGDYDFLLLNLVEYLEGKGELEPGIWFRQNGRIRSGESFRLDHDLDCLPFIDRDLTKWRLYSEKNGNFKETPGTYTMVGRDCWWRKKGGCTFCSWPTLYPSYRMRKPELLVDEIGALKDKYKVKEVFDDTGTFPVGNWLRKFAELMIERGYNEEIKLSCNMRFGALKLEDYKLMKKAGFRMLLFGLESASQRILDELNKGLTVEEIVDSCRKAKEAGLTVHITIMFGYPNASKEEEFRTYRLARKLMEDGYADTLQSTLLMPYPGSTLYEMALEKGWLRFSPGEWERWDMSEPVLKGGNMSPEEVKRLCDETYRLFLSPKYVLRRLLSIRSFADLKFSFRGTRKILGHIRDFR